MTPLWIGVLVFFSVSLMAYVGLRSLSSLGHKTLVGGIDSWDRGVGDVESVGQLLRDRRLSKIHMVDQQLRKWYFPKRIQLAIARAGLKVMTDTWLSLCFGCALLFMVCAMVFGTFWPITLASGALGFLAPMLYLVYRKRQRCRQIEAQLPDALDSIARAMQAGNSFPGALAVVGRDASDPLGPELRLVSEEINFGSSTREGLLAMADRIESMDVRYFVIAVLIHSQTGGNLTELLRTLSTLIRDRQRLRKLGHALSAEGRLSAWILILMPFLTAALIHFINPDFMSLLWTHPVGLLAVQIMLALMLIGSIWMWRIVHFKI